jgi:molecular chaperone HtpG
MPDYLRFVKGVVDAQDLSLNVSREILQQDRQIQLMHRRLAKKVLSTIKEMRTAEPERYATFWREFGRVLKEGLLGDPENRDAILAAASFASTHDAEQPTTLADYAARMKEGQKHVYYLTGESRQAVEHSPHMEAFRAKGIEVLLLTDPVDEVWVDVVPEFDGKQLRSVAKGEVELDGEDAEGEDGAAAQEREKQREEFAGLLAWMTERLGEQVKEVRLSNRLTTSAACVVTDSDAITPALENIYRAMGQEVPHVKRILEVNPKHPLIAGLNTARAARPDDAALGDTAELVHSLALLAEGGELADPARFVTLVAERLERTL